MTTHTLEDSREGDLFVDGHGNALIIDGAYTQARNDDVEITHYHWSHLSEAGATTEATETMPGDDGARWMSVDEFESRRDAGELRTAAVVSAERRECPDCGHTWVYSGDADRPTCPECKGKRTAPTRDG